ncbi:uncharacterized protein LOC121253474 [Juglans microcarpa x Juglans regia]|uniref:uncharacterized protein LOC121253474 n=1 Tax=Juglans microcarpa x Juglans regia TaxID=2249226 RepID=UPI001B7F4966|nr:uncharacterized protein LOC121253474 [Juglans microcarpa x Juglans regia]
MEQKSAFRDKNGCKPPQPFVFNPLSRTGSKDLIDDDSNEWNEGLIRSVFNKQEVDHICSDETAMHVLWHCPATRDVWVESHRAIQKWSVNEVDLLKLWEDLSGKFNKNELEEVAVIMRDVWLQRNIFIFENKFSSPSSVIRTAKELREEFHSVKEGTKDSSMPNNRSSTKNFQKWLPPGENSFKTNWDVACDIKHRQLGIEVFIRDEKGEVIVAYCGARGYVDQPVIAEGLALRKAIEPCSDLGLNRVTFEGDAQNIVKAIYNLDEDLCCYGSIIENSKSFLFTWSKWTVQYTCRNTNTVAHILAKASIHSNVERVYG